ncbi:MAG: VanZ family protein [Candidatus Nanoarchaeia archaeon]
MKNNILKEMILHLEKNKLIPIVLALLLAFAIFYTSSNSFKGSLVAAGWKSYAYHFGIYSIFSFFVLASFASKNKSHLYILAIIVAIFYGATDEFHQYFVPGRACTLVDFLTNSIGVLFTGVFYAYLKL